MRFILISIFLILILLSGCASIITPIEGYHHYNNWCMTCGNKGFVSCDNCYNGIMCQSNEKCWKCRSLGLVKCPQCNGLSNLNGEWKSVRQ